MQKETQMTPVIKDLKWIKSRNELRYRSFTICKLRKDASAMIKVIEAFEDEGFDTFIDNPLWDFTYEKDNRSRAQKTIAYLNKNCEGVRFGTAENGRYLTFELVGRLKLIRDKACGRA
jgi:hypothetical protein